MVSIVGDMTWPGEGSGVAVGREGEDVGTHRGPEMVVKLLTALNSVDGPAGRGSKCAQRAVIRLSGGAGRVGADRGRYSMFESMDCIYQC